VDPVEIGLKYDRISRWWDEQHVESSYGLAQVERALACVSSYGSALDVGCGAGGRFIRMLQGKGFSITGIDISNEMIALATAHHPKDTFIHHDICLWDTTERFDFIVAWDSLFHLLYDKHVPVVSKLSRLLAKGGVLVYTLGNARGEHVDQWRNDEFYYSSIGIDDNVKVLLDNGLSLLHLELDQYPDDRHAYIIATKR